MRSQWVKKSKTPDHETNRAALDKSLKAKMGGDSKMQKAADDILSRAAKDSAVGPESKAAASRVFSGNLSGKGEEKLVGGGKQPTKRQRAKLNMSRDLAESSVSMKKEPSKKVRENLKIQQQVVQ